MGKRIVRLTESDFKNILESTVNKILREDVSFLDKLYQTARVDPEVDDMNSPEVQAKLNQAMNTLLLRRG